jgi:type III secretory pathway component EscR
MAYRGFEIIKYGMIIFSILRNTNVDFLRQMAIPDPPTFIPQVQPSNEQQLHQQSDLKSLLKKPYVYLYDFYCTIITSSARRLCFKLFLSAFICISVLVYRHVSNILINMGLMHIDPGEIG